MISGPEERQGSGQSIPADVIFNVFEDVNERSRDHFHGFYVKLNKKVNPGECIHVILFLLL